MPRRPYRFPLSHPMGEGSRVRAPQSQFSLSSFVFRCAPNHFAPLWLNPFLVFLTPFLHRMERGKGREVITMPRRPYRFPSPIRWERGQG